FRAQRRCRVAFHKWLQWLLDQQLAAAAAEIGLVHDLPIGVQAEGADAWTWQDAFAHGISVGAPPGPFNQAGQDWAVPPFDPWRLRSAAYEPFIQTLRAAFRHGVGLRVDHVMGLFRLFWIPNGMGPDQGVYVRYPYRELLDILALESHRAGAFVVGEDLGTVEDIVRDEMADRCILSYRLLWFEQRPPGEYRRESVAALTTHDLPTLAGIWEGSDPDESVRERLVRYAGVSDGEATEEVAAAAYRALARCPSRLVAATLEDAVGVAERPNKPGTIEEWPNWSLGLPLTLEQLRVDPRPARLAGVLRRGRDAGDSSAPRNLATGDGLSPSGRDASWPARSGWLSAWPSGVSWNRLATCSTEPPPPATTWASSPRSSSRAATSSSATCRRASRTC